MIFFRFSCCQNMNYLPPTGLAGMQDGVMLPNDSLLVVLYTYKHVLAFVCAG